MLNPRNPRAKEPVFITEGILSILFLIRVPPILNSVPSSLSMNSVNLRATNDFINVLNTLMGMIVQYKRRHNIQARRDQWQMKIRLD